MQVVERYIVWQDPRNEECSIRAHCPVGDVGVRFGIELIKNYGPEAARTAFLGEVASRAGQAQAMAAFVAAFRGVATTVRELYAGLRANGGSGLDHLSDPIAKAAADDRPVDETAAEIIWAICHAGIPDPRVLGAVFGVPRSHAVRIFIVNQWNSLRKQCIAALLQLQRSEFASRLEGCGKNSPIYVAKQSNNVPASVIDAAVGALAQVKDKLAACDCSRVAVVAFFSQALNNILKDGLVLFSDARSFEGIAPESSLTKTKGQRALYSSTALRAAAMADGPFRVIDIVDYGLGGPRVRERVEPDGRKALVFAQVLPGLSSLEEVRARIAEVQGRLGFMPEFDVDHATPGTVVSLADLQVMESKTSTPTKRKAPDEGGRAAGGNAAGTVRTPSQASGEGARSRGGTGGAAGTQSGPAGASGSRGQPAQGAPGRSTLFPPVATSGELQQQRPTVNNGQRQVPGEGEVIYVSDSDEPDNAATGGPAPAAGAGRLGARRRLEQLAGESGEGAGALASGVGAPCAETPWSGTWKLRWPAGLQPKNRQKQAAAALATGIYNNSLGGMTHLYAKTGSGKSEVVIVALDALARRRVADLKAQQEHNRRELEEAATLLAEESQRERDGAAGNMMSSADYVTPVPSHPCAIGASAASFPAGAAVSGESVLPAVRLKNRDLIVVLGPANEPLKQFNTRARRHLASVYGAARVVFWSSRNALCVNPDVSDDRLRARAGLGSTIETGCSCVCASSAGCAYKEKVLEPVDPTKPDGQTCGQALMDSIPNNVQPADMEDMFKALGSRQEVRFTGFTGALLLIVTSFLFNTLTVVAFVCRSAHCMLSGTSYSEATSRLSSFLCHQRHLLHLRHLALCLATGRRLMA